MIVRSIVPYTRLHPITAAALRELASDAERVDMSGSDLAYWEVFTRLWGRRESFLLIEHDIEPNAEALEAARSCGCLWGRSDYAYSIARTSGLGFTRFAAELMAREPTLPYSLRSSESAAPGPQKWQQLDWALYTELTGRGYVPCIHPSVEHHHWMRGGVPEPMCSCGSHAPLLCPRRRHHADAGCACE